MSIGYLFLVVVNLGLLAAVVALWAKMHRSPKEDPRLSKGLQLLQSKIAILEDLSDRTEMQFKQLTALLESKIKEVTSKIQQADQQVQSIHMTMEKSMEVAKIFQDKIPHQEIIERQNTIKYVKAAKLAHQGVALEEIAKQVELSRGELEFICKVNRDQLMFSEDSLPSWVKNEITAPTEEPSLELDSVDNLADAFGDRDMSAFFEVPKADEAALQKLGEEFRKAKIEGEKVEESRTSALKNFFFEDEDEAATAMMTTPLATEPPVQAPMPQVEVQMPMPTIQTAVAPAVTKPTAPRASTVTVRTQEVRPVQFRKIDLAKTLG